MLYILESEGVHGHSTRYIDNEITLRDALYLCLLHPNRCVEYYEGDEHMATTTAYVFTVTSGYEDIIQMLVSFKDTIRTQAYDINWFNGDEFDYNLGDMNSYRSPFVCFNRTINFS